MGRINVKQLKLLLLLFVTWLLGYFVGRIRPSSPSFLSDTIFISRQISYAIPNGSSIASSNHSLPSLWSPKNTTFNLTTVKSSPAAAGDSSIHECQYPVLDPFDVTIKKYTRRYPTLDCSPFIPSVVEIFGEHITIDTMKIRTKVKDKSVDFCKYRNITRTPGNDFRVNFGAWSNNFYTAIRLRDSEENIHVDCFHKGELVARSYLARVKKKPEVEKKRSEDYQIHVKKNMPKETLSVLLVGIDGTSRQNFIRSMPKTRDFLLEKLHAFELHRYNKVGINTFPNVMPFLTGFHVEEVTGWTTKEHLDKIDHLFLWNKFQKAGYRTSLFLDYVYITPFHYLKRGWAKPPFDFNPRPISVASEADIKIYRGEKENCMGDTPEVTLLNDYWLQLTTAYNNTPSTPYFAFSFLARLTHDDQNKASAGDELYFNFFHELHKRNVLNNTLLIFFSDHGERFGDIRHTYNGLLEAKMPLLFFIFPPWFEKKYPEVMKTFRINTNRLMTTFDLHATLKDVLYFTGKSKESSPLKRSISLFSEIPANRTCEMAGIPVKFCLCTRISPENIASADIRKHLSQKLVTHVGSLMKNYRDQCETLTLKETMNAFTVEPEAPLSDKNATLYYLTIQTSPNDAVYEATVMYRTTDKSVRVYGDVSRLNMYKGQAECIADAKLRPFCYCKKIP